jgi:hypothetical protein
MESTQHQSFCYKQTIYRNVQHPAGDRTKHERADFEQKATGQARRTPMQQHNLRIVIVGASLLMLLIRLWPITTEKIVAAQSPEQSSRPTLTPIIRPTLTPASTSPPHSPSNERVVDVRWSQVLSDIQRLEHMTIFSLTVRGENMGSDSGSSAAILHYHTGVLRLLDVLPYRTIDWIPAHDEVKGKLTLGLGSVASGEQVRMRVRFVALRSAHTVIRLVRDDEQDHANPLFLNLEALSVEPIKLTGQENGSVFIITGRGYKPGEQLFLWANTRQDRAVAIDGEFFVLRDDDGSINLTLPPLQQDVESIVVYGRMSEVVGTVVKINSFR